MQNNAKATADAPIDVSIILEWENVLLSEQQRCFLMLSQLREQLKTVDYVAEVIVLFSPEQVARADIEQALEKHLLSNKPGGSGLQVRLEEAQGRHYYELKNEGAARAQGKIIIFMDSDVVPEHNWLKEISRVLFERPEVDVVAGVTHLAHESILEKAFALAWFFPLREPQDVVHADQDKFYANSVAFRRDVFLRYPFPKMIPGVTRGSCGELARTLVSSGIPIWTNTAARAQHPPPSDWRHYVVRGLAQGRDHALPKVRAGKTSFKVLRDCFRWSKTQIVWTARQVHNKRGNVGLKLWQAPLAFSIMVVFYVLAFVGGCVTTAFPEYASKHWQI